jgi:hypothetical protein
MVTYQLQALPAIKDKKNNTVVSLFTEIGWEQGSPMWPLKNGADYRRTEHRRLKREAESG